MEVTFWLLAPLLVVAALGILFVRKDTVKKVEKLFAVRLEFF